MISNTKTTYVIELANPIYFKSRKGGAPSARISAVDAGDEVELSETKFTELVSSGSVSFSVVVGHGFYSYYEIKLTDVDSYTKKSTTTEFETTFLN